MAYAYVAGATSCMGARAPERRGEELAGDVAVPHTMLTKRCEDTGDVKVRPHDNFGGCAHDFWVDDASYRDESVRKKRADRWCHA